MTAPRALLLIATIALAGAGGAGASGSDSIDAASRVNARAVVTGFNDVLVETLDGAPGPTGRRAHATLMDGFDHAFALEAMAESITLRHWHLASEASRNRFVVAYRRISAARVIRLFAGTRVKAISIQDAAPGDQGTFVVKTRIEDGDGPLARVDYILSEVHGRWQITDTIIAGTISEVQTRRSEYRALLHDGGLNHLSRRLETKSRHLVSDAVDR